MERLRFFHEVVGVLPAVERPAALSMVSEASKKSRFCIFRPSMGASPVGASVISPHSKTWQEGRLIPAAYATKTNSRLDFWEEASASRLYMAICSVVSEGALGEKK
jgi:hypothetical protein